MFVEDHNDPTLSQILPFEPKTEKLATTIAG